VDSWDLNIGIFRSLDLSHLFFKNKSIIFARFDESVSFATVAVVGQAHPMHAGLTP
jgi:hypothetical protein